MKLKYDFECMDMGDEIIAVPVGEGANQIHGVVKLNQEGMKIFNMLKEDISEEDIVNRLVNEYSNDKQKIAEYVQRTIATMKDAQLLE